MKKLCILLFVVVCGLAYAGGSGGGGVKSGSGSTHSK